MARMTIARKAALFAATAGLTATLAAPAASADAIDDYLAKVPSGQISCEQAAKYYTNPTDYNNKKRQALAVATFDSRGPQIRDAISRAGELWDGTAVTTIEPVGTWYDAEDYHQDFFAKNPGQGYCNAVAVPKVNKVRKSFAQYVRAA